MKWLVSGKFDTFWFLFPNFLSVGLGLLFFNLLGHVPMPFWFWLIFVLLIDVGHVYSTLFRVYFVPEERAKFSQIIWLIPVLVWISGAMLYSLKSSWFWTALAYVAVFHFVRQQYGFFAIYHHEPKQFWRRFDRMILYLSMIHPIVYWHSHPERVFRWFVQNDFLFTDLSLLSTLLGWLLVAGLVTFLIRHSWVMLKQQQLQNSRAVAVLTGTALSWHVGIVATNSDIVFTVTNVLSHGLPYYGLILAYAVHRRSNQGVNPAPPRKSTYLFVSLFICFCCFGFAYLEEGLWHSLHWRTYMDSFIGFHGISQIENPAILSLIISLLAVPQGTHYVLDGFIWKLRGPKSSWTTHFSKLALRKGSA